MYASKVRQLVIVFGLVALVLSCDVAGGLLTQSELATMYEVWIDLDGITLGDGDIVRSDSSLVPVIEASTSISDPESLVLTLVDMDGSEAARIMFLSESGSYEDMEHPSQKLVSALKGPLPPFTLPEALAEGYYNLEAVLYDAGGRVITTTATLVLVYNGIIPAPRIETFPSSPAKGQPVFLRLVTGLEDDFDPWIRWHIGTAIRREGYASEFADRLLWQIPEADGFFNVRAELFPFKPPEEVLSRSTSASKSRLTAFRADLILAVAAAQVMSFTDGIERAYAVDFKAEPEYQQLYTSGGSAVPMVSLGRPYLESHQNGYGHALHADAGYLIQGSILPQDDTAFTLSLSFEPADPAGATGAMLSLYDGEETRALLRFGLSGGLPYLEVGDSIVQAFADLPVGLSQLVLEVVPSGEEGTEAIINLFLNNELVGNGSLSSSVFRFPEAVMTLIGGPEGLDAVYDELSVSRGRYQAFLMARIHDYGRNLIAASGFEGGAIGRGILVQGPARAGDGFIELVPEASLEIPLTFGGFTVAIEGYGAPAGLMLELSDGSLIPLFVGRSLQELLPETIPVEGDLVDPEARMEPEPEVQAELNTLDFTLPDGWLDSLSQSVLVSVEAVAGGLRISDGSGRNEKISTTGPVALLRVQSAWPAPARIRTLLVRTYSPSDSIRRADMLSSGQPPGGQ